MHEFDLQDSKRLIADQIEAHKNGLAQSLAHFEPVDTAKKWHATIRAVEEFINVPLFGIDDDDFGARLIAFPLDGSLIRTPHLLRSVRAKLEETLDAGVAGRFIFTMLQTAALNIAFQQHGRTDVAGPAGLGTVGGACGYFQSRRRQFAALLYTIPGACMGSRRVADFDTLNVFLPLVEHCGMSLTSLHHQAMLADMFPDFRITEDGGVLVGNRHYQPLDPFFLDPERASIMTVGSMIPDGMVRDGLEPLSSRTVFSAAELRNSIVLLQEGYAQFGLNDTGFGVLSDLVREFSGLCEDDYFVSIDKRRLMEMLANRKGFVSGELHALLVNPAADYLANLNAFHPFIDLGACVVSNVNLLSRFLYDYKSFSLENLKRFQIRAGFMFEEAVKRDLAGRGFDLTGIKRVNRKEFDVVAIRGGVIHNFQCKNNSIDLKTIECERAAFLRYNRLLASSYKRALAKEEAREWIFLERLGLSRIRHAVVSRFPVITDDPRIVAYNAFEEFLARLP